MSKLYTGSIGFSVGIVQKGAVPLDDRSVVQSFNDLLNSETFGLSAYEGMLVAVVDDQQVYMLVDKANSTSEESWVAVGSGNGSLAVETYAEAIELATADNIGQIIYVKTNSSYDPDGEEGEASATQYEAAPYIVIGAGTLQKLAASTASGNIEGDVAELKTKVSSLETKVGGETSGLIKDVKDLQDAVDAIDYPVKGVNFNGENAVNGEGIAEITVDLTPYALQTTVDGINTKVGNLETGKVDVVEGSRLMTETEGTKLKGIAEGAQVNVIETVKVNGTALDITEKSVNIEIETIKVKNVDSADKMLTLTENGEVKSELSIVYLKSDESGDGKPYIALYGKGGTTLIDTLDATDFIKDGMLSGVELVDVADSKKSLRLTWNTESGKETVDVDVSELIDYYYAGNGIAFDETQRKFSIDLKEGERFLVVDASGLGISETNLWAAADEKYDAKGLAEEAETKAKGYADELNTAMDTRVKTLEDFDHSVYAEKENVYSKEVADTTFVKTENFNEFSQELETKLENIAEGAQVNVIESVTVNGVVATIDESKNASVKIEADDIELGTAIKNGEEDEYGAETKLSVVLQGIQDSIRGAIASGVKSVSAGDAAIVVDSANANNPTVSLKVEESDATTIANGHIGIIKGDNGIYAAMYYGGDDTE